jgi:hypothetical protein
MSNRRRGKAWLMLILWIGSFSACLFRCLASPAGCVEEPLPCCQSGEETPTAPNTDGSAPNAECPFCRAAIYAADGLQTPAVLPPGASGISEEPAFAAPAILTGPVCPSVMATVDPPPGITVSPASRWGHRARSQSPPALG